MWIKHVKTSMQANQFSAILVENKTEENVKILIAAFVMILIPFLLIVAF